MFHEHHKHSTAELVTWTLMAGGTIAALFVCLIAWHLVMYH